MEPIVHGLEKRYSSCLDLERVNFHSVTTWHQLINPLGSPEFALVTKDGRIIYRWSGVTETAEFDTVIKPACE